jgi:hypothetical protein
MIGFSDDRMTPVRAHGKSDSSQSAMPRPLPGAIIARPRAEREKKLKQLKPKSFRCAVPGKQSAGISLPSADHGTVRGRHKMDNQRKAGLHLLLSAAAVLGCAASILSATGPAIHFADSAPIVEQSRA